MEPIQHVGKCPFCGSPYFGVLHLDYVVTGDGRIGHQDDRPAVAITACCGRYLKPPPPIAGLIRLGDMGDLWAVVLAQKRAESEGV